MSEPIQLPSPSEVNRLLTEFYETHGYIPAHPAGAPLPEVPDHPDEDPDERL